VRDDPNLSSGLRDEVASGRPFLYEWGFGLEVAHPDLPRAQRTVADLIRDDVSAALRDAGPRARALDLACNEGWWSHRLLEWGASEVVAVDAREDNARRARLLRDQHGIGRERLDIVTADATTLDPDELGRFDVVLCLGLLYHLEDPIGTLRLVRSLTGGLLAVETQVTRDPGPIAHGWGSTDDAAERTDASFALRWEQDPDFPLASVGGVVSLIPNLQALRLSLAAAGFADVRVAQTDEPAHSPGFVSGDRVVALAS
jgi:SAM-dependent methyltransferase